MSLADIAILAAKSAVVAGMGLVLARVVARRAGDRVVMLRSAVVLTLALPLMTALLPVLEWAVLPAERVAATAAEPIWAGRIETGAGYAVSGVIERPGPEIWIALAWLAVSAALGLRLALGLVTLMRWSDGARAPRFKAWTAALEALAGKKGPRLLVSDRAAGPLSWGLPPGAILIDKASEARPETAPAVIAHELAHLKRGDWAFLMLSRLMVAMFWFNPLCWRLHAELVARSEEAADAEAVRSVDRATYAHALVALALQPGAGAPLLPASGMAASPKDLKERITSLMQPTARRRPVTLALSLVALAAVATPIAALEIARRDPPAAPEAPAAPHAPEAPPVMAALGVQPGPPLPAQPPAPPAPPAPPESRTLYIGADDQSPEAQAAREAAHQAREAGRALREQSRQLADEARRLAEVHVRDASRTRAEAEQIRIHAQAAAEHARVAAAEARVEAARAMAEARVEMTRGADQMREGADQMREEARRLRDADYRAEVIEENRRRGHTVTDEELRELSVRLPQQADELDRQADRLARQAREA